jgi:hypothetical protein
MIFIVSSPIIELSSLVISREQVGIYKNVPILLAFPGQLKKLPTEFFGRFRYSAL